jgi:hypothetical protein
MENKHNVTSTQSDALQREWTKIVAQAWADPDFRKRLEKNPRAILKERGVEVSADVDLSVIDRPTELQEIERAVRPIDMAVAAGFAAPTMPGPAPQPQPIQAFPVQGFGGDYYGGGADPTLEAALNAYSGPTDPTLEAARWKLGICPKLKVTGSGCAYFHWGGGQPQQFPTPQIPTLQPQMPTAPYAPQVQPQQPPTAAWAGGAETLPYYPGGMYDVYSGAVDPTLEAARWKLGICPRLKVTGSGCAYFHWGAAQPFAPQPFAPQMPGVPQFATPPPYATPGQPQQPQQPTAAWAATVPTQCFSGAAPPFVPPNIGQPGYPQYYTQPTSPGPGPQTRPAIPGSA